MCQQASENELARGKEGNAPIPISAESLSVRGAIRR
jgi:hypothetical protein